MSAPRRYRVRIQVIHVYDIDVTVDVEPPDGLSYEDLAGIAAYDLSTLKIKERGHLVNVFSDNAEVLRRLS